jgi:hypothetical protein
MSMLLMLAVDSGLFRATAATLLQAAANPQRLGAAIGGLMVLHTWGQRLEPNHLHYAVNRRVAGSNPA